MLNSNFTHGEGQDFACLGKITNSMVPTKYRKINKQNITEGKENQSGFWATEQT